MEQEFGKWFLDIAKYVLTAVKEKKNKRKKGGKLC